MIISTIFMTKNKSIAFISFRYSIIILLSLLCFFPILIGWGQSRFNSANDSINFRNAVLSQTFERSLIISIASTLPFALDIAFDFYYSKKCDVFGISSRTALLLSICFSGLFTLLFIIQNEYCYLVPSIVFAREVFNSYTMLFYLYHYGGPIWRNLSILFLFCLILSVAILRSFMAFLDQQTQNSVIIVISVLSFLLIFILFFKCYSWFREFQKIKRVKTLTFEYKCCSNYMILLSCTITVNWIVCIALGNKSSWLLSTSHYITISTYVELCSIILLIFLNGRAFRHEIVITRDVLDIRRKFIRYISHEIRTPLNIVHVGINILKTQIERGNGRNDKLQTVAEIADACDVALSTLNSLLYVDKLEGGQMTLDCKYIPVKEFLLGSMRPFFVQALQLGIDLTYTTSVEHEISLLPFELCIDKSKMNQVMHNLLSNSLKYTQLGGVVSVQAQLITAKPEESIMTLSQSEHQELYTLRIEVTDDGIGIPMEHQKEIFNEFVQFNLSDLKDKDTAGLGLWISKEIVELHGGKITVYSGGKGQGTSFYVDMPLHRAHPSSVTFSFSYRRHSHQQQQQQQNQNNDSSRTLDAPQVIQCSSNMSLPSIRANSKASFDPLDSHLHGVITQTKNTPPPMTTTTKDISSNAVYPSAAFHRNHSNNVSANSDVPSLCSSEVSEFDTTADFHYSGTNRSPSYSSKKVVTTAINTAASSYGSSSSNNTRKLRLLVVDDVPLNRKMMIRLLRSKVEDIEEAVDGLDAVNHVQTSIDMRKYFDAILMDYMMPNMDGPTATREIRNMGFAGKIIGVTGNALSADLDNFIANGADKVFTKPVDIKALEAAIDEPRMDPTRKLSSFLSNSTRLLFHQDSGASAYSSKSTRSFKNNRKALISSLSDSQHNHLYRPKSESNTSTNHNSSNNSNNKSHPFSGLSMSYHGHSSYRLKEEDELLTPSFGSNFDKKVRRTSLDFQKSISLQDMDILKKSADDEEVIEAAGGGRGGGGGSGKVQNLLASDQEDSNRTVIIAPSPKTYFGKRMSRESIYSANFADDHLTEIDVRSNNEFEPKFRLKSRTKRTMRVLMVDNEVLSRKMACRLLRDCADVIGEAEDMLDAFHKVKENVSLYGVVLVDLFKFNSDEVEIISKIRRTGFTGKVIGLQSQRRTTSNMDTNLDSSVEVLLQGAEIDGMIFKPLNPNDLTKLMLDLMAEASPTRGSISASVSGSSLAIR